MIGLNKQQRRRLHLVALAPLLLLGGWFSDGEFKNYFPTNLWGYCSLDAGCTYFKSVNEIDPDDGINFKLPVVGIWDGGINHSFESHDSSAAKFKGDIDEEILLIQGNIASHLTIKRNARPPLYGEGFNGCNFYHIKVLSADAGLSEVGLKRNSKEVAPFSNIFNFDCRAKSRNWFVFTNPKIQQQYIDLFDNHRRNVRQHEKLVEYYSLISFFIPLAAYFLFFSSIQAINFVIHFVRYGTKRE